MAPAPEEREGKSVPERLIQIEMEITALRELTAEQRAADRNNLDLTYRQVLAQLTAMATAADRFALAAPVEKLDARVSALETLVSKTMLDLVPRQELEIRLKGVADKQDTMQNLLVSLSQTMTKITDNLAEDENARKVADVTKDRKRTMMIAIIGVVVAGIVGIPTFVGIFRSPNVVYRYPPPTTTTTVTTIAGQRP